MHTRSILLSVLSLGLLTGAVANTSAAEAPPRVAPSQLQVTVVGCSSDLGSIRVALFASAESFLKEPLAAQVLTIRDGKGHWRIESLPAGFYAIAAVHDRNGNGKTDRNFLGLPKEPYGFSNRARRLVGPPRWEQARFKVSGAGVEVEVRVR